MIDVLMDLLARCFGPKADHPAAPARSDSSEEAALTAQEMGEVQNLIRRATDVTSAVSQHVGEHHTTIQTLNTALSAVSQGDSSAVAAIVCQLLSANHGLQDKLERAELKLQVHSRQLREAVTASRTDELTGLLNRRALDEELSRCLSDVQTRGRKTALMLLDVDHFKRFNDVHGHVGGDHALKYVADALRTHSRESDILARYGGEEFAVIFVGSSAVAVQQRADQIRTALSRGRVVFEGREARLTASAGVADVLATDDIQVSFKRADDALYAAKRNGRDCCYRYEEPGCQRVEPNSPKAEVAGEAEQSSETPRREAAAELAHEAFADTTFVSQVARRIAEWRRGGTTFTVVLARLDRELQAGTSSGNTDLHTPMRAVLLLARESARDMDVVTRWTDDGVAILLPGTAAIDAKGMARRLRDALARCEAQTPGAAQISMCMGLAEGIEGNDANRVLHRAWLALDSARVAGPGTIFVHDGAKSLPIKSLAAAR